MTAGQRALLAFLLAFGALAFNTGHVGWGAGWLDPVGRIAPQDEVVYSHTALAMVRSGDWLTPHFLGRYVLYKPPLTYWMSGASAALLGARPFALRLPSLLAAALTVALVFAIADQIAGAWAAVAAALLVFQSPLFFAAARRNLMDAPLTATFVLAAWWLLRDPTLARRSSAVTLGLTAAAAILVKSIAGLLVLGLILSVALITRARWRQLALVMAVCALATAPWFVYQAIVHPHWLWRELVLTEILGYGTGAPPQTSQESHFGFYLNRVIGTDPLLALLAVAGAAGSWKWLRGRRAEVVIPPVWIAIVGLGIVAFSYRNAAYLVPAIPAAALLAVSHRWSARYPTALAILALVLCGARIWGWPQTTWGLPYSSPSLPSSAALERYAAQGRARELVLVTPDDEFVSALLPIPRVRYLYLGRPDQDPRHAALDFYSLGIIETVDQFLDPERFRGEFRARLREVDLDSEAPIGTVILAHSAGELARLIAASPQRDFSLPRDLAAQVADANHDLQIAGGRAFLLAH